MYKTLSPLETAGLLRPQTSRSYNVLRKSLKLVVEDVQEQVQLNLANFGVLLRLKEHGQIGMATSFVGQPTYSCRLNVIRGAMNYEEDSRGLCISLLLFFVILSSKFLMSDSLCCQ